MKPVTLLTMILLLILANETIAQNKIFFHKNTFDKTFTNCTNPPEFGSDSSHLKKYFEEKLQDQISKTHGQIKIGVLIDTAGKPQCEWIENSSNFKIFKNKLNLLIDSMPVWNYGIQNGYKVNCAELIVLTFNRQNLEATYRIGTE